MALSRTFDEIMTRRPNLSKRTVQTTVLIVGEGDTEKAFLDYLKSLYVTRGCGVSVTIRNAHGKGPINVVDTAIRQSRTVYGGGAAGVISRFIEVHVIQVSLEISHRNKKYDGGDDEAE